MSDAALYSMLYVLCCALAGSGFAAALFFKREGNPMALYEVTRTDAAGPGEFVSATVIAGGTAQAREAVAHMTGVITKGAKRNVRAERLDVTGGTSVLAAYFDESEPAPAQDETLFDAYPYDDMIG